jgi:hypothetical protein
VSVGAVVGAAASTVSLVVTVTVAAGVVSVKIGAV